MKIVIDEKIPYLRDALVSMGCEVIERPGVAIVPEDVKSADALFVRTRTRCDAALLQGSSVRFIGTATIGYDHIDADFCCQNSIVWTNAAGCNAGAVLQYVQSTLYQWACDNSCSLRGLTLGIVGVGEIGSRVAEWAARIGMRVLLNDPPRSESGEHGFTALTTLAEECDIITFHPTLSNDGAYKSYHLADSRFFASLCRCKLLVNASRGPVVDNAALLEALTAGRVGDAAIDVWEGEPEISIPLLNKVYVATPHIAGYSAEGKINATRMVLEAFARFAGCEELVPQLLLDAPQNANVRACSEQDALLAIYSPLDDTRALRENPEKFESLRNNYKLRREPSSYKIYINGSILTK